MQTIVILQFSSSESIKEIIEKLLVQSIETDFLAGDETVMIKSIAEEPE